MTEGLPSFAGAEWLAARPVRVIFATLEQEGDSARVVGGAVRDALMDRAIGDLDFATTATPDVVVSRAEAAGLKAVPTGIEHGTVTLVVGGTGYQVTTLREDIETDGRHAVVRFGRDWAADARRRDFTINALSADASGTVHDPLGGYPDIAARRIRFIGDPDRRIAEDRLRILRLFRFHAEFGRGELDRAGLAAAIRARHDVRELSAERVAQEMRRLVVAVRSAEVVTLMQEAGILPIVLGGMGYLATFARLVAFEAATGAAPAVALRLAALGVHVEEDVARLAGRLRLSNAERDRMGVALVSARKFLAAPDGRTARRALYRAGEEAYRDGIALAAAWAGASPDDPAWGEAYGLPEHWPVPVFPLSGNDVLSSGGIRGPAVGQLLRRIEDWWVETDFAIDSGGLKARLQQAIAASQ